MKYRGLKNKGNDHQLQEAPDCQTNSLVSTIGNVKRTQKRITVLIYR